MGDPAGHIRVGAAVISFWLFGRRAAAAPTVNCSHAKLRDAQIQESLAGMRNVPV